MTNKAKTKKQEGSAAIYWTKKTCKNNDYPECLFMDLDIDEPSNNLSNILLSINFNEQHLPILGSHVSFGFTGGELKVVLIGARCPYETREPKTPLEISLTSERTVSTIDRKDSNSKYSYAAGAEASITDTKASVKETKGTDTNKGLEKQISDKFQHTKFQMTSKGTEEQPNWCFELASDDRVLKGRLDNYSLGLLVVDAKVCRLKATFEILRRDIEITGGDGVWPDNLGREKKGIIFALIRSHLYKKLRPHVSSLESHYE